MTRMFRRSHATLIAALALTALITMTASQAEAYFGVEVAAGTGQTGTDSGGTFLSATKTGVTGGGEGQGFDEVEYITTEGTGRALADATGSVTGDVASPLLRSLSIAGGDDVGADSYAGAIVQYQYNGAAPGLVTYSYSLSATLVEPDPDFTAAFVRGRAALVTGADFFTTNENDYAESSAVREDRFNLPFNENGPVDVTGSLSFTADPGEVFHLVISLNTQAGHSGASADAYSTLLGSLTATGGTLTIVPEPTSVALVLTVGAAVLFRRRVRQR